MTTPAEAGPAAPQRTTSLPVISVILGILSIIFPGFVLGIAAIVVGAFGRKKAASQGVSTRQASVGIVLGCVGIAISVIATIVLVTFGDTVITRVLHEEERTASQLYIAENAAESYRAANGTFEGITTSALADYGYTPPKEYVIGVNSTDGGRNVCVEGYRVGEPLWVIHTTNIDRGGLNLTDTNGQYHFRVGRCPIQQ